MADDAVDSAVSQVPASEPAAAPVAPSPAASPAAAPATAPAAAPAASTGPQSSIEAAVLGLEATGLKLDAPLPDDQVVRIGSAKDGKAEAGAAPLGESPGESTASASAAPTGDKPADEALPEQDLPDPTEAELATLQKPFRRRFQQVISQNARLKETVARVQPAAQQYQQLQTFMASHELDARSAANALRIAALAQGAFNGRVDPSTVAAELQQWADQLRGLSGEALPPDVQTSLDDGEITEAHAKEIAKLRAAQVTTARRAEIDTNAANSRVTAAHADQIASAIRTWEQSIRTRDPDYARKAKTVESHAVSLRLQRYAGGLPPSVKEGLALVQEAYDFASEQFKGVLPPRTEVRNPLNGATTSKSTVRAEPKSSLEAAIQGLERMGS